ncbi:deaminase, partial [Tsukamurella conjunctivitidis]
MGTLSYTATVSVDGYVADADGDFQWSAPGDEVFDFHVERMAAVSTEVLGRKTYQLMRYWESEPEGEDWGEAEKEFARGWKALDLVVASSTLGESDLWEGNVTLVPHLGLDELQRIVDDAAGEVEIFGPTVAAEAIRAGLVQDFRF